jgi:hypothetical protein
MDVTLAAAFFRPFDREAKPSACAATPGTLAVASVFLISEQQIDQRSQPFAIPTWGTEYPTSHQYGCEWRLRGVG